MLDGLLNLVKSMIPVSQNLENDIKENVVVNTFGKSEFLLKEGQICNHLHFIVKGVLISYYELNESEMVNWIFMENDFTISLTSFYKRQPSFENIIAYEDSVVVSIHHDQLMMLYDKHVEFNIVGRKLTEFYHCENEAYHIAMRKRRAEDKYRWLLEKRPEIIQRVPGKYIASYLGITGETVSRIRRSLG